MNVTIVFDIDAVLCDLAATLRRYFAMEYPNVRLDDQKHWSPRDAWPELSDAQVAWWESAYTNPYYLAVAEPVAGAQRAVQVAHELGYDFQFRSSRPVECGLLTETWLYEWGFLPRLGGRVQCGHGQKEAALTTSTADLTLFVDDDANTINRLARLRDEHRPDAWMRFLCLKYPYNTNQLLHPKAERLYDNFSLCESLKGIQKLERPEPVVYQ